MRREAGSSRVDRYSSGDAVHEIPRQPRLDKAILSIASWPNPTSPPATNQWLTIRSNGETDLAIQCKNMKPPGSSEKAAPRVVIGVCQF